MCVCVCVCVCVSVFTSLLCLISYGKQKLMKRYLHVSVMIRCVYVGVYVGVCVSMVTWKAKGVLLFGSWSQTSSGLVVV